MQKAGPVQNLCWNRGSAAPVAVTGARSGKVIPRRTISALQAVAVEGEQYSCPLQVPHLHFSVFISFKQVFYSDDSTKSKISA